MSTAPTTDHDAQHGHGKDHHPHVLPMSTYFGVFGTLLFLTFITVGASRIDLGAANLFIAMAIATTKALCVALVFMHLLFDKKFNLVVFASSIIFLAIFIGFTLADTGYRGHDGRVAADGPSDIQNPFAETRSQAAMKKLYEKPGGKEVAMQDRPVGPKSDIGLNDATPLPGGEAVTVDVPKAHLLPGAPREAAPKKEE
jgi:cytochrome c oxidase subunit 4